MRIRRHISAGALLLAASCIGPEKVDPLAGDPSTGADPEIHLPAALNPPSVDSGGAPEMSDPLAPPPGENGADGAP